MMGRWLLFLMGGVLTISAPCFAATTNVVILATQGWQSTGVNVTQGTSYGVWQTQGLWTVDNRSFRKVDGAGYALQDDAKIFQGCKIDRSWPYGLLIGRVGSNVFQIGRATSFTALQNGILELSIHDSANCLADNAGSLSVSVEDGLDTQGALKRFIDGVVGSLTPAEQNRLLKIVADIFVCRQGLPNAISPQCAQVILGVISLIISPQSAE